MSGSRSMKIGSWVGSDRVEVERMERRESGPPDWRVDMVVSKSLPPTLSLMRSCGGAESGFWSDISGFFIFSLWQWSRKRWNGEEEEEGKDKNGYRLLRV